MNCYICNSSQFLTRKGKVRDASDMRILECVSCGLTTLDTTDHVTTGFYENSGMHGKTPPSMESWLKDTSWDDQRRFEMVKSFLPNKRLLDFGCGAGGFLQSAKDVAAEVTGIELEARVCQYWAGKINIVPELEKAGNGYDLITAFHVVEHLPDTRLTLRTLGNLLNQGGRIVLEVPSSEDVLLTLYDCEAFQNFTYWSQHLFLFNASTLQSLAHQAGLRVIALQHYQRYPLSNHLYWLSQGKPGGHQLWAFLDTPEVNSGYGNLLASIGKTDTLIAHLERF